MNIKRYVATTLVAASLFSGASVFAAGFKDVPTKHWAYNTINWGVNKHTITGYPDGTFKPEKPVTEAEFLVMLIRNFKQLPSAAKGEDWSQPYYIFASSMHYPVAGGNFEMIRNWNISRGRVAEIVAGATGKNYMGEDAIRYLLANGLAQGKDPKQISVEGFKKDDYLTRAEAVQFIKTAMEKGLTELKERPLEPSPVTKEMMKIPATPQAQTQPQPKPVEQTKPTTTVPVLHEKKATELNVLQSMKMPKDAATEPYIEAFLKNIKYDSNGNVTVTIPKLPSGYSGQFGYDDTGEKTVSGGETFSFKNTGFGFSIFKGYEEKNSVVVESSGAYYWRTQR